MLRGLVRGISRRWWITGGVALGLIVAGMIGLFVVYPKVGARMIRSKVVAKLGARLGREIEIGAVDVKLGHAVLRDLTIRGDNDGAKPLIHVDRIDIDFGVWKSFVGSVELGPAKIDGVSVAIRRDGAGRDNVLDIVERLRGDGASVSPAQRDRTRPTSIEVSRISMVVDDAITGSHAVMNDGDATWVPGDLVVRGKRITTKTPFVPSAGVTEIAVHKAGGKPPKISITDAEVGLWQKLALTGITGSIDADPKRPGHYTLDLAGGYGGVPGRLWSAKGGVDPRARTASVDLVAAKFQLERLAPILAHSPVVDYADTSIDTKLHLELSRDVGVFSGSFTLRGLNVGHPLIAEKEVHDLDLSAVVEGRFDLQDHIALTRGDFVVRDLPFSVTGSASRAPREVRMSETAPKLGPGGIDKLEMRLVIPPIDCQRVLQAIPTEMAPYLSGYELRGMFDTDVDLAIDWANLDATKLGGHVGIKHCRVIEEPADSPKRLRDEFEHYVEVERGQWMSFVVGPSNDDFVPLSEISPYLIKSIMSTEDSAFYHHRGFITSEFRTALVNNLKAGRFRYGASSITMQFVKNVLLYREKTLARKLQELFLTWHVENTLSKDRILEIYFNVIEYGPGLYGIGPASWHYFSKAPKDLSPVEAAFFSSILPAPKERYKQYCAGTLTKWTTGKIARILAIMRKRDRLTEAEYQQALLTPLLFAKDLSESEDDCMKRVRKAIKNSRSTNPLKK